MRSGSDYLRDVTSAPSSYSKRRLVVRLAGTRQQDVPGSGQSETSVQQPTTTSDHRRCALHASIGACAGGCQLVVGPRSRSGRPANTRTAEPSWDSRRLLPPISDTKRDVRPFVEAMANAGVRHVVLLSLMGINRAVPHWQIEQDLRASGIPWTFLRPAFFSQDLGGAYRDDIRSHDRIRLVRLAAEQVHQDSLRLPELVGARVLR